MVVRVGALPDGFICKALRVDQNRCASDESAPSLCADIDDDHTRSLDTRLIDRRLRRDKARECEYIKSKHTNTQESLYNTCIMRSSTNPVYENTIVWWHVMEG